MKLKDLLNHVYDEEPITIFEDYKNIPLKSKMLFSDEAKYVKARLLNREIDMVYTDECIYGFCIRLKGKKQDDTKRNS